MSFCVAGQADTHGPCSCGNATSYFNSLSWLKIGFKENEKIIVFPHEQKYDQVKKYFFSTFLLVLSRVFHNMFSWFYIVTGESL